MRRQCDGQESRQGCRLRSPSEVEDDLSSFLNHDGRKLEGVELFNKAKAILAPARGSLAFKLFGSLIIIALRLTLFRFKVLDKS